MTDTIKINREMLREACDKIDARQNHILTLGCLMERELFGPKKPREWKVWVSPHGEIKSEVLPTVAPVWEDIRVREVLENE